MSGPALVCNFCGGEGEFTTHHGNHGNDPCCTIDCKGACNGGVNVRGWELADALAAWDERNAKASPRTAGTAYAKIAWDVLREVDRAVEKHPLWPDDMIDAATIVAEENGELQTAVLQSKYEPDKGVKISDIRSEAVQTAAASIRFVRSLDSGLYLRSPIRQHNQTTRRREWR